MLTITPVVHVEVEHQVRVGLGVTDRLQSVPEVHEVVVVSMAYAVTALVSPMSLAAVRMFTEKDPTSSDQGTAREPVAVDSVKAPTEAPENDSTYAKFSAAPEASATA
jgi:hypothetical protein